MKKFLFIIPIIMIGITLLFGSCSQSPVIEETNASSSGSSETTNVSDTSKPQITLVMPTNGQVVTESFDVLVFGVDNRGISKIVIGAGGQEKLVLTNLQQNTNDGIIYSLVLTNIYHNVAGTNEVFAFCEDTSGNVSSTNKVSVVIDTEAPTVSIVSPTNLQTVSTNVQLVLSARDDTGIEGVYLSINGTNFVKISSSTNVSTNISLANGTNSIRVYSKDLVGRMSVIQSISLIVDSDFPFVVISSPTNGQIFNTSNVAVSGVSYASSGVSNTYISVDNLPWESVGNSSNWSKALVLAEGSHTIKVYVLDNSNRQSSEYSANVVIDYTPPTLYFTYPLSNITIFSEYIAVQGKANDNISGVDKVLIKVNNGSFVEANGSTNWFVDSVYIPLGTNTIYAYAVDKAGNVSSQISITFERVSYTNTNTTTNTNTNSSVSGEFPGNGSDDPRDWRVYFVMTDRFVDGYSGNNNIYGDEYRAPDNNSDEALRYYNGGDFKGLIDNLDYIKSMGFNAIWITPVVKQPEGRYVNSSQTYDAAGFHGYWGYDFDSIDPHLESPGATLQDLINIAHSKGIRVILDIVVNHGHGGDASPTVQWYANRLKVKMDGQWWTYGQTNDPYYNNTNGVADIWENSPGFFNYRGDYKLLDLLDFNECDPRTRQHLINIYKKFIDMGVDGFRIDTVAYMRKQWWGVFADAIWEYAASKGKPWFWQVGEAWVATRSEALSYTTYSSHKAFSVLDLHGSCMDFPGQAKGVFAGSSGFEQMANIMSSDYSGSIDPTFLGTFVDNHDKPRFPGGWADNTEMVRMWKNALNWYFLARGIPIVYYGTEFEGTADSINDYGAGEPKNRRYVGQDRINRVLANPNNYPIYKHLKLLNSLRGAEISLRRGSQVNIYLSGDIAVFKREYVSSVSYVVLNKGNSSANYTISLANGNYLLLSPSGDTITTNTITVSSGSYNVSVGANSFSVLVFKYPDPASSVAISGSYTVSMNNVVGNLWKGTINVSTPGNVNIFFNANYSNGSKVFGDNDEVGTFLPVSGVAIESSTDPITFNAPVAGPYEIEFNDATLSYSIKYVGSVTITTIIVRSFVGGNNWVGVCGSYSPVTSYDDSANHVPGMAWWGNDPSTPMVFKGVDNNNRNIWVWTSTNVPSGKKIEFKPRRNGADWYPSDNLSVLGGQSADVTYDWGLTSSEGAPDMNDTVPPVVTITYPTSNSLIINTTNITVTGNATDNKSGVEEVRLSVDDGSFGLVSGTSTWSTNLLLNYGSHYINVYAVDNSNNVSITNRVDFLITNIPATNVSIEYYRPDWSTVNIHYNAGNGWTSVPGVAMSNIGGGWWQKTISVVSNYYRFCFNNGSGTWDNNGGNDYVVSTTYTNIGVSNRIIIYY